MATPEARIRPSPSEAAVRSDDREDLDPLSWRHRGALALLALVAVVVGYQAWPWRLDDVPANLGDPALIAAILDWVSRALVTDPSSVFDFPFFYPEEDVLAFSEPLVPQALTFGVVRLFGGGWPLALTLTSVAFVWMNLLTTFSLTRYVTRSTAAGAVAATSFGFGAYVYSHWGHTQLLSIGFLPWAFLLVFKLLDRPRWTTAVGLAAVQAALVLGSLYHGMIYVISLAVILFARPVLTRALPTRAQIGALALTGVLTALVLIPFALTYFRVQRRYDLVRDVSIGYSMDLGDLIRPPLDNAFRNAEVVVDQTEHALSPGLVTWFLAAVALGFLLVGAVRRRAPRGQQSMLLVLLLIGAAVSFLLASSTNARFGGQPSPFDVLYAYLPGFSGMRVSARLAILGVLVACVLAGSGAASLLRRAPRAWRSPGAAALCLVIFLELVSAAPWVTAPPASDRAENDVLAQLDDGAVLELPIWDPATPGGAWAYVESPRMAEAVADGHPRVNGYSGFAPPSYTGDVLLLNRFPETGALDRLGEIGVRYVVLHLGCEFGYAAYSPEQAERVAATVGPDAVAGRTERAIIVDLTRVGAGAPGIGAPVGTCG